MTRQASQFTASDWLGPEIFTNTMAEKYTDLEKSI